MTTYPEGRICKHEGCTVRLSIYNSEPFCSLHPRKLSIAEARRGNDTQVSEKEKNRMAQGRLRQRKYQAKRDRTENQDKQNERRKEITRKQKEANGKEPQF